jgi:hypothetical protein
MPPTVFCLLLDWLRAPLFAGSGAQLRGAPQVEQNCPFGAPCLPQFEQKATNLFPSLNLTRLGGNDFGPAVVARYLPGYANVFIAVGVFRLSEFWSLASPNQNRKYFLRIGFIEI